MTARWRYCTGLPRARKPRGRMRIAPGLDGWDSQAGFFLDSLDPSTAAGGFRAAWRDAAHGEYTSCGVGTLALLAAPE